jgi:hypothetical protein
MTSYLLLMAAGATPAAIAKVVRDPALRPLLAAADFTALSISTIGVVAVISQGRLHLRSSVRRLTSSTALTRLVFG